MIEEEVIGTVYAATSREVPKKLKGDQLEDLESKGPLLDDGSYRLKSMKWDYSTLVAICERGLEEYEIGSEDYKFMLSHSGVCLEHWAEMDDSRRERFRQLEERIPRGTKR